MEKYKKTVNENEKGVKNVYTLGGIQSKWFLTEDGLYNVLFLFGIHDTS